MYSLNKTPIFLEFLKKTLNSIDHELNLLKNLENEFFIVGRCNCNQSDCATVYLKRRKNWKLWREDDYYDSLHTYKGYVNINLYAKNYLEIESIVYKDYPYKYEINKLFGKKKNINKSSKKFKKLTKKDKNSVDKYFKFMKRVSLYEETFKNQLDFRATKNQKLLCRVR